MVSNITTAWGLEESNFVFINKAKSTADMNAKLARGHRAVHPGGRSSTGMAWTGWGWDVKMGDFLNSGDLDVVQTDGLRQGRRSTGGRGCRRWP